MRLDAWNCFPMVLCYSCNLHEGKDDSCVKHDIAVRKPFSRFLVAIDNLLHLWETEELQLTLKIPAREEYACLIERTERLGKKKEDYRESQDWDRSAIDKLSALSLSKWKSFLKYSGFCMQSTLPDMYILFRLRPLHHFHTGI